MAPVGALHVLRFRWIDEVMLLVHGALKAK